MTRRVAKGSPQAGQYTFSAPGKTNIPTPSQTPPAASRKKNAPAALPQTEPHAVTFRKPDGVLHREDGPAVVPHTDQHPHEWWRHGKRHRTDGPAVLHADGSQEWWADGVAHRTDGPAVTYADGTKQWLIGGRWHRLDGPAVIRADGTCEWWIDGREYFDPDRYATAVAVFQRSQRRHRSLLRGWQDRRRARKTRVRRARITKWETAAQKEQGKPKKA
jgi:hypothetical protein